MFSLTAAALAVDFAGRQLQEGEFQLPPTVSFSYGGATRTFLHQAATPVSSSLSALVIELHGFGGSKEIQWEFPTWRPFAPNRGIVVAWPDGISGSWNAGQTWCGAAWSQQADDVGFIDEVITRTSALHAIDSNRIYITGHSCGCSMAQRCELVTHHHVPLLACANGSPPTDASCQVCY